MSNRRRSGGGGGHDGGQERWLLTYADMITLLLALFIVLFAMSTLDARKFDNLRRTLSQTFHGQVTEESGQVLPGSQGVLNPNAPKAPRSSSIAQTTEAATATSGQFKDEQRKLDELAKMKGLEGNVGVDTTQRGIVISLAGDEFFTPGSAELSPSAKDSLRLVALNVKNFGHEIQIEGYTDGVPYSGPYGTNMVLSFMRANSVFEYFLDHGVVYDKMRTLGYGEGHPKVKPEQPHDDMKVNRRIEIVILAPAAEVGGQVPRSVQDGGVATPAGPGTPVTGIPEQPNGNGPNIAPITIVDDITAVSTH